MWMIQHQWFAVEEGLTQDTANIQTNGGGFVQLVSNGPSEPTIPDKLLGGDHFGDFPRSTRCQTSDETCLPRTLLCKHIEHTHKICPRYNN